MSYRSNLELQDFLSSHPLLRLIEYCDEQVVVEGTYLLNAQMDGYQAVQGRYNIRITFPTGYPRNLPKVFELDGAIPRDLDYHTYPDGSFCLGSEIRIKSILRDHPTATGLLEEVVKPFLYKIVYKLKFGISPGGELAHGDDGLISDYQRLFKVNEKASVLQVLRALGKRKREANKLSCPCGCGNRLGKCDYRFSLRKFRHIERRRWFRKHLADFLPPPTATKN